MCWRVREVSERWSSSILADDSTDGLGVTVDVGGRLLLAIRQKFRNFHVGEADAVEAHDRGNVQRLEPSPLRKQDELGQSRPCDIFRDHLTGLGIYEFEASWTGVAGQLEVGSAGVGGQLEVGSVGVGRGQHEFEASWRALGTLLEVGSVELKLG